MLESSMLVYDLSGAMWGMVIQCLLMEIWTRNSGRAGGLLGEHWLHRTKGGISERAAKSFGSVVRLVAMLLVEEGVESRMEGLDLILRDATEETMPLGEVDRVVQHVKLREWPRVSF